MIPGSIPSRGKRIKVGTQKQGKFLPDNCGIENAGPGHVGSPSGLGSDCNDLVGLLSPVEVC